MFGLRLLLSFALTLLLVGVVGYLLMNHELRRSVISQHAAAQQADARSFEAAGARVSGRVAIREIDELMDAIGRRPGTIETLLIDQQHIIRASADDHVVGTRDSDPRIDAALTRGRSYAGNEASASRDRSNFEFVVPVTLPGGRYAYEVSFDHRSFDAQTNGVRRVFAIVGLLALLGGGAVFYLVGGRALMRSHRLALTRATRDGLTDLPNQRAFQDEFSAVVATAERHQEPLALALLDVDDFKFLNDRHGHPYGDSVLKQVAQVLRNGRPGDRGFRVGGDEFGLLLAHTDGAGVRVLARRLQRALNEAGLKVSIGVSALRPGQLADTLRAEADAALYEAKRQGGDRVAHYDDIRNEIAVTSTGKRDAVRDLIEKRNVSTVYQPIWHLVGETLLGVEALSRPDPSYGLSGPAEAFDIAEQIGRVHQLDVVCITAALTNLPVLPAGALLFLNLCPQTLDLDSNSNDWLREAVTAAQLTPEQVVVEVTERFQARTSAVIKCLQQLREQGFKIALDDVGTGNSGLEMLRRVKAEYVKIDGAIVAAATTDPSARAVLMAMATFARQTGSFVIAEGIEDEETLTYISQIDSDDLLPGRIIQGGQGFGLGRPAQAIESAPPAALQHNLAAA